MAENEHPKGALLFILVFLVLVVVFWLNTQLMMQYWATNAPESPVSFLDLESSQGGPYQSLQDEFALTKKVLRWIDGKSAVRDDYHGLIVPAFCVQAARSFFDGF